MKILLAIPFYYYYCSRIKKGSSIFFNFFFEWIPWIILSIWFSKYDLITSLFYLGFSYLAFISLYEIGYIFNDYFSINFEKEGRNRAPLLGTRNNLIIWILSRIITFFLFTNFLPFGGDYSWNILYFLLIIFFASHNLLKEIQFKSISFFWLAFLKYIIPVIFIIKQNYIYQLLLVAALIYVPYRFLSYLESKKLLLMSKRKSINFRTIYFCAPILLSIFLKNLPDYYLYFSLSVYYALIILVYFFISKLNLKSKFL